MQWYEILVIVLSALFVGWVVVQAIRNKIRKKGDCNCAFCVGSCSHCRKKKGSLR